MALFRSQSSAAVNKDKSKAQGAPPPAPPVGSPLGADAAPVPKEVKPGKAPYAPPQGFRQVREDVQQFLANEIKSLKDVSDADQVRRLAEPVFAKALDDAQLVVSRVERESGQKIVGRNPYGYTHVQKMPLHVHNA